MLLPVRPCVNIIANQIFIRRLLFHFPMVMVWTSVERRLARPSRHVHALSLPHQERLDSKHVFAQHDTIL